ncbi:ion channel [Fusibacter bizertensis]|uniref:Ion channel n=1 Tax=Fusibacter bizertensis TaxID=1488331 RepID=A0ABT6NAI1_9FIRM|nr:ion channel [Fusibacter bizertensis]MDH8677421.1 ion channel [Fusibacter bizertensis]
MNKDIRDAIIFIWISAIVFFIILFISFYSLFSNNILNSTVEFNKTMDFIQWTGLIIFFVPAFDLLSDMLKIAHHKKNNNNLKKNSLVMKTVKVAFNYLFLIFLFTSITFLLELSHDFNDKSNELAHYFDEYRMKQNNNDYQVKLYDNKFYFNDTYYKMWFNDTMYVNSKFTDTFIELLNHPKDVQALNKVLALDTQNIFNKLIEDLYFIVQTASTLGYGNIVPQYPVGMFSVILISIGSQFITIIGVTLIIRE